MARWLIIIGVLLILIGALLHYFPQAFSWFGKLPGDIRIESERSSVFIPVTSMIIISVVLTLVVNLFIKR